MVPLPSECRESKVKYPAPWGGKGGNASAFQGLPWGIYTFHFEVFRPSDLCQALFFFEWWFEVHLAAVSDGFIEQVFHLSVDGAEIILRPGC